MGKKRCCRDELLTAMNMKVRKEMLVRVGLVALGCEGVREEVLMR